MQFQSAILGCCGVNGFYSIPSSPVEFKRRALREIRRYYGNNLEMRGSHIIVTVRHQQAAHKYLPQLGFKRALGKSLKNSNSGNNVTLFTMSRVQFNKKLKEWDKELEATQVAKKSANPFQ